MTLSKTHQLSALKISCRCATPLLRTHTHTHTHTYLRAHTIGREARKSTRQQRPKTARRSKHARRFIIPFKNTRVRSHALTCGLGAWRQWDTRSSLHLNGASHINHLIRISLTALKLMKSISWTFIQRLIDNVKKKKGGIHIHKHTPAAP